MSSASARSASPGVEPSGERLAAFIAGELGLPCAAVHVANLRRMPGGASRETWSLDLAIEGEGAPPETRSLVLRRDPPGRGGESDRSVEFRVLRAAGEAGVPVPRVHWCCRDPGVLGTPFFVMDRVSGETLPRRLLRDPEYARARQVLTGQLGEIAARIHGIPLDHPDLAGVVDATPEDVEPARAALERTAAAIRELAPEPHPALDLAERWLRERLPANVRRTLVHGDYRVGNVIFDATGARAVLDWELSHVGDPVEDLGWLCTRAWRFGGERPAGGVGAREELLAGYARAGGAAVDPDHLRFWEALGSFKVALVFIQQASVYLSGRLPSVELASLGRRTAEAEEELVRLMEEEP